jgi:hypothetical protein
LEVPPSTLPRSASASSHGLPRIIHQTNENSWVPPRMFQAIQSWIDKNPIWEHRYYTANDRREFIRRYYDPHVLEAYDTVIPGAYESDLWRYCVLYQCGGLYVDSGHVCLRSLDDVFQASEDFVVGLEKDIVGGLHNAFITAQPHHPILRRSIDLCVDRILHRDYGKTPHWPTHPLCLGGVLNSLLCREEESLFTEGVYDIDGRSVRLIVYKFFPEEETGYIYFDSERISRSKYPQYDGERKWWECSLWEHLTPLSATRRRKKKPYYGQAYREGKVYRTPAEVCTHRQNIK